MDAKQKFALTTMEWGRKVFGGPGNEVDLADCERDIKAVEEWAASGKAGLPPGVGGPIVHTPTDHKFGDGQRCRRCGIEEIYWKHFPDCSRFKPSWDPVRAAFSGGGA